MATMLTILKKVDSYIKDLHNKIESQRSKYDTLSNEAEQFSYLQGHKYLSLKSEYDNLRSEYENVASGFREVAKVLEILLQSSGEHSEEIRCLSLQVENKDLEITEKNSSIKGYLDKIAALSETVSLKEGRILELEADNSSMRACLDRLSEEKDSIEKNYNMLKANSVLELRKARNELEESSRGRECVDMYSLLKGKDDKVKALVLEIEALNNELRHNEETTLATQKQFSAELSAANKLVELHKKNLDEWSKRYGELKTVFGDLDSRCTAAKKDYSDRIEKETSTRAKLEMEVLRLKEQLYQRKTQLEQPETQLENDQFSHSWFLDAKQMDQRNNVPLVLSTRAKEQDDERKQLFKEISDSRNEICALKLNNNKLRLEAVFAREKLERFMEDFDRREETFVSVSSTVNLPNFMCEFVNNTKTLYRVKEMALKSDVEASLLKEQCKKLVSAVELLGEEVRDKSEKNRLLLNSLKEISMAEQAAEANGCGNTDGQIV